MKMILFSKEERARLKRHLVRNQLVKSQLVKNLRVRPSVKMMILMPNQFWRNAAAVIVFVPTNLPKAIPSAFASQLNAVLTLQEF